MRRVYGPLVAISGFLMIWLGMSADVERELDTGTDRISLSQAQAEKAPEGVAPAAGAVSGTEKKAETGQGETAATKTAESAGDSCIPSQALSDLNQRRRLLEERETVLQTREQELTLREKALEDRLKQLESYRADAAKMDASRKKDFEERIARTVELLESMNPKAASQLIATSDERLAVEAMGRMSTAKLSKIMNVMEPKRSVRLMELLAGNGTPVAEAVKTVPETNPKKEEKL